MTSAQTVPVDFFIVSYEDTSLSFYRLLFWKRPLSEETELGIPNCPGYHMIIKKVIPLDGRYQVRAQANASLATLEACLSEKEWQRLPTPHDLLDPSSPDPFLLDLIE